MARYKSLTQLGYKIILLATPIRENFRPWQTNIEIPTIKVEAPYSNCRDFFDIYRKTNELFHKNTIEATVSIGYNSKYIFMASYLGRKYRIPSILYLVGWDEYHRRPLWKELIKRIYCSNLFDSVIVPGTRAIHYAYSLGFTESQIWCSGNVIDNQHFAKKEDIEIKGLLPEKYFLTVSRLSKEKNIPILLSAFDRYIDRGGEWDLCIVGAGQEDESLKKIIPLEKQARVRWLGWKNYAELPFIYQNASCFVLASKSETWGLVVNEAMSVGLPIIISRACGCLHELCRRGVNGYDFDPDNENELTSLLLKMSSEDDLVVRMGEASKEIINNYTLDNYALSWQDCIETTIWKNFSNNR